MATYRGIMVDAQNTDDLGVAKHFIDEHVDENWLLSVYVHNGVVIYSEDDGESIPFSVGLGGKAVGFNDLRSAIEYIDGLQPQEVVFGNPNWVSVSHEVVAVLRDGRMFNFNVAGDYTLREDEPLVGDIMPYIDVDPGDNVPVEIADILSAAVRIEAEKTLHKTLKFEPSPEPGAPQDFGAHVKSLIDEVESFMHWVDDTLSPDDHFGVGELVSREDRVKQLITLLKLKSLA